MLSTADYGICNGNLNSCIARPVIFRYMQKNNQADSYTFPYVIVPRRKVDQQRGRLTASAVPRKIYTFVENPKYLHENMFDGEKETLHTLHNWIELSAGTSTLLGRERKSLLTGSVSIDARGYIQVADRESFNLGEPYTTAINRTHDGPAYMMSVFHQLHCLVCTALPKFLASVLVYTPHQRPHAN